MSDHEELTALVHSYARLLDEGDLDAVVALFDHSTWRSLPNGSLLRGSEEVKPVYVTLMAQSGKRRTKHLITNLTITVDPDATTASSHCHWTVLEGAPGGPIGPTLSGQYTDAFEKVRDGWRFTDRLITVDLAGRPSPPIT
jgi:3-phenylpropionate/cinnamic acid dioxygenase small subunit